VRHGGAARPRRRSPVTISERLDARGRPQVMSGCSLPPCAAPGQLHEDEGATTAGNNGGGTGARVSVPAALDVGKGAARVLMSWLRGGGALNRPEKPT
jgi:hypothetical protein